MDLHIPKQYQSTDRLRINKQEMNNIALNCETYSSFVWVSTDQRIVTTKIRLSLRKNDIRTTTTKHYDCALLNDKDIRDKYTLALRNKYDVQQKQIETPTPNEEYENTHLEATGEFIPTKQRRKYWVQWETLAVREKHADVKAASKFNRKNPTNTNTLKLKKAQNEFGNIYLKKQTEYIQNQIG